MDLVDLVGLGATGTCDLTTTGRRSGRPVQVEIWYVVVGGILLLTGTPGRRGWLANLRADPRARLRLRDPVRDVDVVAEEVTDPSVRRDLLPGIWAAQPWYAQQPYDIEQWVARSPMVVLRDRGGHDRGVRVTPARRSSGSRSLAAGTHSRVHRRATRGPGGEGDAR